MENRKEFIDILYDIEPGDSWHRGDLHRQRFASIKKGLSQNVVGRHGIQVPLLSSSQEVVTAPADEDQI